MFVQPQFLREIADKELAIDTAAAAAEMARLVANEEEAEARLLREQEGIDDGTIFLCLHPKWRTTARAHSPLRDGAAPDEGTVFLPLAALPPQRPPPVSARSRANKLAEEHKRKAKERQEAAEKLAERHAAQRNAALARRRRAAASKDALRRSQRAKEMADEMLEAQKAKIEAEARSVAEEAKARQWMRRVLEAEEERRSVDQAKAAAAAAATSAHERWKAFRERSAGHFDGDEWATDSSDDDEEEMVEVEQEDQEKKEADGADGVQLKDEANAIPGGTSGGGGDGAAASGAAEEWVTEEVLQKRGLKAAERDECLKRVLDKSTRSLRAALGLREGVAPDEIAASARKQLRLLHPDYGINLALKGTKQHRRIELAFKKLNGLKLIDGAI